MTRRGLEIAKEMEALLLEAKKSLAQTFVDESRLSAGVSRITHELELVDLNPFQAFTVMQELQSLLRERREVKHDQWTLITMQSTLQGFDKHITLFGRTHHNVRKIVSKQPNVIQNRGVIKKILDDKKAARQKALDVVFPEGETQEVAPAEAVVVE